MTSAGVFNSASSGCRKIRAAAVIKMAMAHPSDKEAATQRFKPLKSCAPKNCAAMTAKPLVSPCKKPIKRLLSELVAPTAASALSPSAEPTIRVSTRL